MTDFSSKHESCKVILFKRLVKLLLKNSWSEELINQAEKECDFSKNYHQIIFPDGQAQILQEFEAWQDGLMLDSLSKMDKPEKIREKIGLALETRIIDIMPKTAMLNNISIHLLPQYIIIANKSAYQTCDLIWKYAGDQSTDFNHYTKRTLLLSVYLSAKAFYLSDNSENHQSTRKFIKNALDNIINIASLKNRIHLPKIEDIPIIRLFS